MFIFYVFYIICVKSSITYYSTDYITDCVSWVTRLTLLDLNKSNLRMCSWNGTYWYVGDLTNNVVGERHGTLPVGTDRLQTVVETWGPLELVWNWTVWEAGGGMSERGSMMQTLCFGRPFPWELQGKEKRKTVAKLLSLIKPWSRVTSSAVWRIFPSYTLTLAHSLSHLECRPGGAPCLPIPPSSPPTMHSLSQSLPSWFPSPHSFPRSPPDLMLTPLLLHLLHEFWKVRFQKILW